MKIVIIGAEAAGLSAAAKARRSAPEAEILVYEKSDVVSFGACGLPYFVGDFFSDESFMVSRTVDQLVESGVSVHIRHEVLKVDPNSRSLTVKNLVTGGTHEVGYDRLMIATGATPVIPPIDNVNVANVFTLKSMADGLALKQAVENDANKEVVIIGAGYIGLEVAEALKKHGKNVRIIQLDPRVLPDSFDQEITAVIEQELAKHGIVLHVSETVKSFTGCDRVTGVVTDKGEYPADLVVISTGVKPNTAFLSGSGIEMARNGAIVIDSSGRTNLDDVYAAGDCATVYHLVKKGNAYIPLATTANKIGRIVGENLAGKNKAFPGTLGTAALKIMDLEAGRTGLTENDAAKLGVAYRTVLVKDKNHSNYLPGQSDIFVKLIYDSQTKVILGGQVVGREGAALRVDTLAAAVMAGMTVDQLAMLDLLYAPPFSRPWDVLNIAAGAAK